MKEQTKAILESNSPFVVVTNTFVQDKNISLKAKGLAAHMFSLPSGWDFSIRGLMTTTGEGRTVIETALKELINAGYLIRTKHQDENGFFRYNYKLSAFPCVENPCAENPHTENLHNNKRNNNKRNIERETLSMKAKTFMPPTVDEVREYIASHGYNVDADHFVAYYEANNWRDAKNQPVKNWKQRLISWVGRGNTRTQTIQPSQPIATVEKKVLEATKELSFEEEMEEWNNNA